MKKLLIICLSLTVCIISLWGLSRAQAKANGLSFSKQATPPSVEPVLAEDAAEIAPIEMLFPSIYQGLPDTRPNGGLPAAEQEDLIATEPVDPPLLALTFDDGPSKDFTPLLLDGLRERGVHATFFMVGSRAERAPELVARVYAEGHAIGGHSYDHTTRLTKLSSSALATQLQKTDDIIAASTGAEPPLLLRPPYGAINQTLAQKTGKAIIMWSIDPRDWDVRDAEKVCKHIVEYAVDGGVVILHDIYASTVAGVLLAIDELQATGWEFVSISELYAAKDILLEAGGIYRSSESYILPPE